MNRILTTLSLSTALIVGAATSAFAQSTMRPSMMHGSMMHGSMMRHSMMMPRCSSGDPVVMVNSQAKTYSMADKSHMMMMHKGGMMNKNMMMKNHMSMMCKSKADAMGLHMMKSSMKGSM